MNYFPMFMDISGCEILILGGGKHGLEKIERLQPFRPQFHVISEHISEEFLAGIETMEGVTMERRRFSEQDLDNPPVFVIAAEDRKENERIAEICRRRHIPVNAVDMQDICDFIFPSMIVTEQLCIGISTGGASPAAAVELKKRVAEQIPDEMDEILLWMTEIRAFIRNRITDKKHQRVILRRIAEKAFDLERPLTEAEVKQILQKTL